MELVPHKLFGKTRGVFSHYRKVLIDFSSSSLMTVLATCPEMGE